MSERDDGGPAFPQPWNPDEHSQIRFPADFGFGGLTVRDYFAAAMMTGLHSALLPGTFTDLKPEHNDQMAEWAYGVADAMLRARKS